MEGFTGTACERLKCEDGCNGFGVCATLSKIAEDTRDELSQSFRYDEIWDADKIMACICDIGHSGYDCSEWVCPNGDDPLTKGQVNEVQLIKCVATTGNFVLYYKGLPSKTIAYNANKADIEAALEHISLITDVAVSFSQPNSPACSPDINIIKVEFLEQFGPLPPLVAEMGESMSLGGGAIYVSADGSTCFDDKDGTVFKSIKGTKEADACAGRGFCNTDTGICSCYDTNGDAYMSSDGYGNAGIRGDCGYFRAESVSSCPGYLQCSGHGVCDSEGGTFRCSCSEGWSGGDCSERECPKGLSWSSYPSEDNKGHDKYSVCSDMGICDRESGTCKCQAAFYGQACEYMACGGGLEAPCHGHGRCMSMNELAIWDDFNGDATDFTYGTDPNNPHTWDGHRVFGCKCDEGYTGYDCSLRECPRGDDPGTYDDSVEIQVLRCLADGGTFKLGFRQEVTDEIAWNASSSAVESALENLGTLSDLNVTFVNGTHACNTSGEVYMVVSFDTIHSDLPALKIFTDDLVDDVNHNGNPGTGSIELAVDGEQLGGLTSVKGTTENAYCNNRGLCDFTTGTCHCFENWASSNGKGDVGNRGDCGYRNQINTNGNKLPVNHALEYQKSIK